MKFYNVVLIFVLSIALSSLSIFTTIHNNFKDVPSISRFFVAGNVYNNLSVIAQERIKQNYPPEIADKPIQVAIVDRVVENVVTPDLVQRLVEVGLTASSRFAQAPTSIINDRVVINTPEYKQQAMDLVQNLELPKFLTTMADNIINSVPGQLVLIDTRSNPNSVLAMIIQARTLLDNAETIRMISWIVLAIAIIVLIILNQKSIKTIFWVSAWSFVFAAATLLGGFLVITSQLDAGLIGDAVNYLLGQINRYAILYLALGVIAFLIWKLDKKLK